MTERNNKRGPLSKYIDLVSKPKIISLDNFTENIKCKRLIKGLKELNGFRNRFYRELEKCETPWQELALMHLFEYFSWEVIKAEKWFYDNNNKKRWRVDIYIADLIIIEIDGKHHRFDDKRFTLDESKDDFFIENGYLVFRRSNDWIERHYKRLPEIILEYLNNDKKRVFLS